MPDKLTASIKIRTTPDEKVEWQEKAIYSGVPLSNLVRQAMSRTNTWTAADRSSIQEQNRQLARIGNSRRSDSSLNSHPKRDRPNIIRPSHPHLLSHLPHRRRQTFGFQFKDNSLNCSAKQQCKFE